MNYPKHIIEIADFIFANLDKNREDVLAHFGALWRKGRRTIERYHAEALEYNSKRIQQEETTKAKEQDEQTKELVKSQILSRYEGLEILSKIARGDAKKIPTEMRVYDNQKDAVFDGFVLETPSSNDRIRAIQTMAKIEWGEAPIVTENTLTVTDPFSQMRKNHGIDNKTKAGV